MDIEKLLYKAYNRRKIMANIFLYTTSVISAGLFAVVCVEIITTVKDMISGNTQEIDFSVALAWFGFCAGFTLLIPVYFCGSMKRGLKRAKPAIDYMSGCIEKLDLSKQRGIKSECDKFFKGLIPSAKINFGQDCLPERAECYSGHLHTLFS